MSEVHPDDYDKYKALKKQNKKVAIDVQKEELGGDNFKTAINEPDFGDLQENESEYVRNVMGERL